MDQLIYLGTSPTAMNEFIFMFLAVTNLRDIPCVFSLIPTYLEQLRKIIQFRVYPCISESGSHLGGGSASLGGVTGKAGLGWAGCNQVAVHRS